MNAIDPASPQGELLQAWQKPMKYQTLDSKYSDWQVEMFGLRHCIWFPRVNEVPNAFWRFMQWAMFGNRWTKMR